MSSLPEGIFISVINTGVFYENFIEELFITNIITFPDSPVLPGDFDRFRNATSKLIMKITYTRFIIFTQIDQY